MTFSLGKALSGIPIIGGAFDNSDDQALDELRKNQELYDSIKTPDLTWSNYTPEQYSYQGDFDPTMATASTVSEDPQLKSEQMAALNRMAGLAQNGLSDVDNATFARALGTADQEAHSGEQAALQDAQARGVGGSGLEFALGEASRQGAANRAAQAELDRAAAAANERALYATAYGQQLGGVRDQNYRAAAGNADILNQFNMANTQTANTYGYNNNQNRQNISNQNVQQNNNAQLYNQQGKNNVQQQNFDNQMTKANGQSGATQNVAKGYYAQGAANQSDRNANTDLLGKLLSSGSKAAASGGA